MDDLSICLEPFDLFLSTKALYFADNFLPESTDFRSPVNDVTCVSDVMNEAQNLDSKVDVITAEKNGCSRCNRRRIDSGCENTKDNSNCKNDEICNCQNSNISFTGCNYSNSTLPTIEINDYDDDQYNRLADSTQITESERERMLELSNRLQNTANSQKKESLRNVRSTDELVPTGTKYTKKNGGSPKKLTYRYSSSTNHSSVSTTASDVTDDVRENGSQSSSSTSTNGKRDRRRPFRFILRRVVRHERARSHPTSFSRLSSSATESTPGSACVSRNTSAVIRNPLYTGNGSLNSEGTDSQFGSENYAAEVEWHEGGNGEGEIEEEGGRDLPSDSRAAFVVVNVDDDDTENKTTGTISGTETISSTGTILITSNGIETSSSSDTGISSAVESGTPCSSSLTDSENRLTATYAVKPSSVKLGENAQTFSIQDETVGPKRDSNKSGWLKRVGSTLSFTNMSRRSSNGSPTSEETSNPTILILAAAASSAVATATAAASSVAGTAASTEAEQRQETIRVEDLLPPVLDEKDVDLSLMFLPQMVVSCMAIWCCGCIMGLIGFIFSVIGSRRAVAEKKKEARRYEILSYVFSLIGFIGGFILIMIFLIYTIITYNDAMAASALQPE